jgi:hypothetical protein
MRTITASLLLLVGSTLVAVPARAKCGYRPVADRLAAAEIVFRGRLVGMKQIVVDREIVDDYREEGRRSSAWLGEFHVEKVWKGSVGAAMSVLTEPIGCGAPFGAVGTSYVVAAHMVGPYLVAHRCQGIPPHDERTALALLGAPKIQYAPDATRDLAALADDVGPEGWSSPSLFGAGFLAGTAVASLMVAWTASRRRRQAETARNDPTWRRSSS